MKFAMILLAVICAALSSTAHASYIEVSHAECLEGPDISYHDQVTTQEQKIAGGNPGFIAMSSGYSWGACNGPPDHPEWTGQSLTTLRIVEEFSLTGYSDQQNFNLSIDWLNGVIFGANSFPEEYELFGYIGDGILNAGDRNLGDLLGTFPTAQGLGTTTVDVTDWVVNLINQGHQYLGISLRVAGDEVFDTSVGPQSHGLRDVSLNAFNRVSVPEPGTLALLGLGLVGMAARRRKV